jgi:hypothetical protein
MIQFQKNRWLYSAAIFLLIGFAALILHPAVHAFQWDGGKDDGGDCPLCQFIAVLGLILFIVFLFLAGCQRPRVDFFDLPGFKPFSFLNFLSPVRDRAPPAFS